jgi:hypothetical protein
MHIREELQNIIILKQAATASGQPTVFLTFGFIQNVREFYLLQERQIIWNSRGG